MSSNLDQASAAIPTPEIVHERWMNVIAQFELSTGIWSDNPQLAMKCGARVEELMLPRDVVQQRYAKN